jgi:integrase
MRNPGAKMAKLDLPYVKQYRDRTGVMRRYFRRAGKTYGPLPGEIGSSDFMEAYQGFLGSKREFPFRSSPGTFGHLITEFYKSVEFANLKPSSRKTYKLVLEPLIEKHGHKRLTLLTRDAARTMIQRVGADSPSMANLTKGILARVFRVAVDAGQWHINPFARLTTYKIGTRHTWTDAELAAFEKRWPPGTRQRLAYALLLYTGQRVGDVVKMHRRDIVADEIHLTQSKTGAELRIPIHSELRKALKAMPAQLMLFGDVAGRPIKADSLTTIMRKAIAAAGLDPCCTAHGLRKAVSRKMAEEGASAKTIAAVTGHKTLKEIERYTAAAEQPKLARAGLRLLSNKSGKVSNRGKIPG